MSDFFRKQEIALKDKAVTLEQKPITEIFKFNSQPYICCGLSGCGKTTLCIDIIYKFAEQCTSIYYITSSKESIRDDTISQIPRVYRRKPTFENIYNIWREIMEVHDAAETNEQTLTKILVSLCGSSEAQHIITSLTERQKQIQKEQYNTYLSQGDHDNEAIEKSKNDSKTFFIDTLSKLILDFASTRGTSKLTYDDMMVLSTLVSPYPKVLLLMDDVSAELNELRTKTTKIPYNGGLTKISEAYKNVIIDILTRGRHYGALICMFLHTIDLIQDKSLINNLIVLNKEAAKKVCNARSFPDEMRSTLETVCPYVFTNEKNHYFLMMNQLEGDICVGKADLHYGQTIPLSKINRDFVRAADSIYSGVSTSIGNTTMIDDDESYYDTASEE